MLPNGNVRRERVTSARCRYPTITDAFSSPTLHILSKMSKMKISKHKNVIKEKVGRRNNLSLLYFCYPSTPLNTLTLSCTSVTSIPRSSETGIVFDRFSHCIMCKNGYVTAVNRVETVPKRTVRLRIIVRRITVRNISVP